MDFYVFKDSFRIYVLSFEKNTAFIWIYIRLLFAQAQKGYEAGAWMGTAFYFGDLNNLYRLNEPGLAFGMIGRYNFNNRVCARIQGNFSRLRASDAKSDNLFDRRRNLRFFSNIFLHYLNFSLLLQKF